MRVFDAVASVVKSGGKTRRAAKMQTLKMLASRTSSTSSSAKTQARRRRPRPSSAMGYEANFNGEAYSSVLFQNCQHVCPRSPTAS